MKKFNSFWRKWDFGQNYFTPPPPSQASLPSRVDKEEALNLVTEYCDYCPFFQYLVREAVESVF